MNPDGQVTTTFEGFKLGALAATLVRATVTRRGHGAPGVGLATGLQPLPVFVPLLVLAIALLIYGLVTIATFPRL